MSNPDPGDLERLAALDLSAAEQDELLRRLSRVMESVVVLAEADVAPWIPMTHPHALTGAPREDEPGVSLDVDDVVNAAAEHRGQHPTVPSPAWAESTDE